MPDYAVSNSSGIAAQPSVASTFVTMIITAATTGLTGPQVGLRRGRLYDVMIGTNGTAANNSMEWDVSRITAGSTFTYAGIISSVGQQQVDPADPSMMSFAAVNSSAEIATVTARSNQLYLGWNQQASYRWVTDPSLGIVWPATSSAGLVGRVRSAVYTGTATMTWIFRE